MSDIVERLRMHTYPMRGEREEAADEIERLRGLVAEYSNQLTGEALPEIERLRELVYAVPPTEHATGQTWKEACEANRDEVARLDNMLRTYRLPDEVVDIKVVIELRAEIERLNGTVRRLWDEDRRETGPSP